MNQPTNQQQNQQGQQKHAEVFPDRLVYFLLLDDSDSDSQAMREYLATTHGKRLDRQNPKAAIVTELQLMKLSELHVVIPVIMVPTRERHPDEVVGQGTRIKGGFVHIPHECKAVDVRSCWDDTQEDGALHSPKFFEALAKSCSPACVKRQADGRQVVRLKWA